MATVQVGSRGEIILPLELRRSVGIDEQAFVVVEKVAGGILVRPAAEVEEYTAQRKAEFLLSNAINDSDYRAPIDAVRELGLDPESIPHRRPAGV